MTLGAVILGHVGPALALSNMAFNSAESDFLTFYFTAQPETAHGLTPPRQRRVSTFWAAIYDAREAAGRARDTGDLIAPESSRYWLAAIGYLCWFDQVGSALVVDGVPNKGPAFLSLDYSSG